MIRPYQSGDLQQLMPLWLDTTIAAHPFIDEDYWIASKSDVEQKYLPDSETFVYEENGEILGFISIMNGNVIGALFVRQDKQTTGLGKALIKFVQANYPMLLLEVYPQNKRAYEFYQRMGFTTISETVHPETKKVIATMSYYRS